MVQLSEQAAVRRLYDRFGFGLGGQDLQAAQSRGLPASVERLLRPTGSDRGAASTPPPILVALPRPPRNGDQPDRAAQKQWRQAAKQQVVTTTRWWLDRMVAADHPAVERLTWFWHGHFATSAQKVRIAALMLGQNQTLRALGRGGFTPLAQAMIVDPALLVWLDGNDNTAAAANENLSREFMELFSLGRGNYTETDVREAARALTGWKVDRATGTATLRPRLHDDGSKTILGATADFDAASFVTRVLNQPAATTFVISRLWFRLVSVVPPSPGTLAGLRQAYGSGRDVTAVLTAMAADRAFRDPAAAVVKQPVEWAVGLMRALGVRPGRLAEGEQKQLLAALRGMGQVPLLPPSVGGWPAGAAWLTTSAALARLQAARLIADRATLPTDLTQASTRTRPEALRRLLGVDAFTPRTADAVGAVADRLPLALAIAACSPEYTVSV